PDEVLPDRQPGCRPFRDERAEAARREGHLHDDHVQGLLLNQDPLENFVAAARAAASGCPDPADCVQTVAPLLQRLVAAAGSFLKPAHFRSDPTHYARNAIHIAPDRSMSLFALVWLPGQWTPVHDHGSWGVVGVVRGVLEERAYMSADG